MMNFEVDVKIYTETESRNGKEAKPKTVKEKYLVQAYSVTEAEAVMNEHFKNCTFTFEVVGAKKSNIIEYVPLKEDTED